MKSTHKNNRSPSRLAGPFLAVGILLLFYALLSGLQIAAFIGLGLAFWGALFSLARNGRYVESSLADSTAKSEYLTFDRLIGDLKFKAQGYYLPAYAQDVNIPDYLKSLREPVVFISENFDGKPPIDELASGKFLSEKANGVFVTAPGGGLMTQMERRLQIDFSKFSVEELSDVLPRSIVEMLNVAKSANFSVLADGVGFEATGVLYQSLYRADPPMKSVSVLGCPLVSAVASSLAKTTGKTVVIKEQVLSPVNCGVHAVFNYV